MWRTSNLIESRISKATQSRPFFLLTLVTFILSIHRHSHFHTPQTNATTLACFSSCCCICHDCHGLRHLTCQGLKAVNAPVATVAQPILTKIEHESTKHAPFHLVSSLIHANPKGLWRKFLEKLAFALSHGCNQDGKIKWTCATRTVSEQTSTSDHTFLWKSPLYWIRLTRVALRHQKHSHWLTSEIRKKSCIVWTKLSRKTTTNQQEFTPTHQPTNSSSKDILFWWIKSIVSICCDSCTYAFYELLILLTPRFYEQNHVLPTNQKLQQQT